MRAPISNVDLITNLTWRYSTQRFDAARKIPADDWRTLEQALLLSPSSYGLQLWRFVVVTDRALRTRLRKASWDQQQIEEASHLVVFSARTSVTHADLDKLVARISEVRELPKESLTGFRGMMAESLMKPGNSADVLSWSARQLYIALGVFLTSAAMLGVDTCAMEGIDGPKYDEILGLTSKGYKTWCVVAAGYRAEDDTSAKLKKVRYEISDVIDHR